MEKIWRLNKLEMIEEIESASGYLTTMEALAHQFDNGISGEGRHAGSIL